jgi:Fe-S cluster assembly protein SufD
MAAPDIKPDTDTLESSLATLFAEVHASLPGPTWLAPLRTEAMARVARDGFPHKRIEAWKYTDLRNKLSAPFTIAAPATADTSAPSLFEALSAYHIDAGAPSRGDEPDGLEIINLADALATPAAWLRPWLQPGDDALRNLNLAFAATGTLIRVGAGVKVKRPIALRSLLNEAGVMTNARSVIMLEEGAELTLVELDEGEAPGQSLANLVTSITLERGARLKHLRLTAATGANVIIRNHDIEIAKDASYESVLVSSGTELVRHQTTARLTGEGANFDVACAYAASADEHTDLTFAINHDAPHTTSRLLTKGVAASHGHAVIQGRVVVKPEAQ